VPWPVNGQIKLVDSSSSGGGGSEWLRTALLAQLARKQILLDLLGTEEARVNGWL
jgi:hypothetical protein